MKSRKCTEDVIKEIKEIYGDKYIIPSDFKYIRSKEKLHLICPKHGDFYPYYYNFITKKHGCKKCSCHIYSKNEFVNDINSIYCDAFSYDKTIFNEYRNKVTINCTNCGKTHRILPYRLLRGKFKCDCMISKYTELEEMIATKLDELDIEYKFQYKDKWLKYKGNLSLDFYLPKYNVGIECQGRFHFEPYKNNDEISIKNYKAQRKRDEEKCKLCKIHGVKLLYFSNRKCDEYFSKIHNDVDELIKELNN